MSLRPSADAPASLADLLATTARLAARVDALEADLADLRRRQGADPTAADLALFWLIASRRAIGDPFLTAWVLENGEVEDDWRGAVAAVAAGGDPAICVGKALKRLAGQRIRHLVLRRAAKNERGAAVWLLEPANSEGV